MKTVLISGAAVEALFFGAGSGLPVPDDSAAGSAFVVRVFPDPGGRPRLILCFAMENSISGGRAARI
jgi:hypothetical protein